MLICAKVSKTLPKTEHSVCEAYVNQKYQSRSRQNKSPPTSRYWLSENVQYIFLLFLKQPIYCSIFKIVFIKMIKCFSRKSTTI